MKILWTNTETMRASGRPLLGFGLAFGIAATAAAQAYPSKPITLIVPFAAGGTVDKVARNLQEPLRARLGQQLIIDNRGGAGGTIGMAAVAKAPADGHTLALVFDSYATEQFIYRKLPYSEGGKLRALAVTSLQPHARLANVPALAQTYKGFEIHSWVSLIAPAQTPVPVLDRLNADVNAVLRSPEVAKRLTEGGFEVVGGSRELVNQLIRSESERWGRLIKSRNIAAE